MRRLALAFALPTAFGLFAIASCIQEPNVTPGDAATSGSGGSTSGTGGTPNGTGGTTNGTGGAAQASGGQIGTGSGGGAQASGGTQGTGSGGTFASGGGTASGGRPGTGGGTTGSGGTAGRGTGGSATGGATGTGGRGTGGSATGGSATGGQGTGGAATGGVQGPTACANLGTAHNGNGSFTFYHFSQGTFREGSGYRTACGYYGTANGQIDTVQNIASMSPANANYFAAIPGTSGFNSRANCGACVQITGQNGRNIIATIADECPYGSDGGNTICGANPNSHLDLSKAAFDQLGYSVGDPKNTTWKFVPCPVTGNVVARVKQGNPNELYIENSILAVTTVQGATRTSYGAWHFNSNLASGQSIQLTDVAGRSITIQLQGTTQNQNQDTGRQFPACQ